MRSAFIVSYDISDPKRLRQVYKTLCGFGEHIQLSVFQCELAPADKVRLISSLDKVIHHRDDQVLIFDIGPAPGRADQSVSALGRPYVPRSRSPIIV